MDMHENFISLIERVKKKIPSVALSSTSSVQQIAAILHVSPRGADCLTYIPHESTFMAVPNDRQCGRSPMANRFCHARDGNFTYVYANEAAVASGVAESKLETREQRCTKLFRAPLTSISRGNRDFIENIDAQNTLYTRLRV